MNRRNSFAMLFGMAAATVLGDAIARQPDVKADVVKRIRNYKPIAASSVETQNGEEIWLDIPGYPKRIYRQSGVIYHRWNDVFTADSVRTTDTREMK